MPFRERVKRALGRKSTSSSDTSSLSLMKFSTSKSPKPKRDSNVYQPGEKMPPPKYRRPVAKEHKEMLESFSFAKAWRRKSDQSQYSPMGSRIPSRRNSAKSAGRKSFQARRSMQGSRLGSHPVFEGEHDEADVANVGLSRQQTHENTQSPAIAASSRPQSSNAANSRPKTGKKVNTNAPFTSAELTRALTRSGVKYDSAVDK